MSCTICGYGFPIADGDAVTLDFEKAKEFLKKHVGSFGQSFEDEETGDTGFGAVLAVIMRRETGINFKFYAAENDLGTPPAILWVPMYPWMLNEKERGITESDLYDLCRKYMDELEIYCDPEEMELEYYS